MFNFTIQPAPTAPYSSTSNFHKHRIFARTY